MKASQILIPRSFAHLVFLFALACALPAAAQAPVYAIGNRVWFDTDNSSTINGAEVGIDGVTVNLYAASDLTTVLATANYQPTVATTCSPTSMLAITSSPSPSVEFHHGEHAMDYWSSGTTRAANGAHRRNDCRLRPTATSTRTTTARCGPVDCWPARSHPR